MGYIGREPSVLPITSSDLANDIVSSNAIADDSISEEHIDNTAITGFGALTSLADTDKFLVSDASDSGNLKYVEKQYLGGGGLIFLGGSDTGSNAAQISVDNVFSATYKNYLLVVTKMVPASDDRSGFFKFRDDTPSDIDGNYSYNFSGVQANNGTITQRAQTGQSGVQMTDIGISNSSNRHGFSMSMFIQDPFTSTRHTSFHGTFRFYNANGYNVGGYFGGLQENNASVRGVTFFVSAQHVNVTAKVYGLVDS